MGQLDSFKFIFDTAEKRIKYPRLYTSVTGFLNVGGKDVQGWQFKSNTWVDPITGTLKLMPLQLTPEWESTFNGDYARRATTDFTFSEAKWIGTRLIDGAGDDFYITNTSPLTADSTIITNTSMGRNAGIYLKLFVTSTSSERVELFEAGWHNDVGEVVADYDVDNDDDVDEDDVPVPPKCLSFKYYTNGTIKIYEDGELTGEYDISGNKTSEQTNNKYISLLITPHRIRDLLFVSDAGTGFVHELSLYEDTTLNQEILPDLKFWIKCKQVSFTFQLTKLIYKTSGYAIGYTTKFNTPPLPYPTPDSSVPPAPGQQSLILSQIWSALKSTIVVPTHIITDLVEFNNYATVFVSNGTTDVLPKGKQKANLRVRLSTPDKYYTPEVYCAIAEFLPVLGDIDDLENDITNLLRANWTLAVSDSLSETEVNVTISNPKDAEFVVLDLLSVKNRAVELRMGNDPDLEDEEEIPDLTILKFRTVPIDSTEGVSNESEVGQIKLIERFQYILSNFIFKDKLILDASALHTAFIKICTEAGLEETELDIPDMGYTLETSPDVSHGEFSYCISKGDKAIDWINKLYDEFCGNFFKGVRLTITGPIFTIKDIADLPNTPAVTIYHDDVDITDRDDVWKLACREFKPTTLPLESNDVWVSGLNPKTRKPMIVNLKDVESCDVTTAVGDRNEFWYGEEKPYAFQSQFIRTVDSLKRTALLLFDRLSVNNQVAEFTCEMLFTDENIPVWRGDIVNIDPFGWYRIQSVDMTSAREPSTTSPLPSRKTTYIGKKLGTQIINEGEEDEETIAVPENGMINTGGTRLAQIKAQHLLQNYVYRNVFAIEHNFSGMPKADEELILKYMYKRSTDLWYYNDVEIGASSTQHSSSTPTPTVV